MGGRDGAERDGHRHDVEVVPSAAADRVVQHGAGSGVVVDRGIRALKKKGRLVRITPESSNGNYIALHSPKARLRLGNTRETILRRLSPFFSYH